MTEYMQVALTNEHLRKMRKSPTTGLLELIKNGLDAGANVVTVSFERDGLEAVSAVTIADDGSGMDEQEVTDYFVPLSKSWKRSARHTGGRDLFGRKGEGRLTAFAIGNKVEWTSTWATGSDDKSVLRTQTVTWSEADFDRFAREVSPDPVLGADASTGTTVTMADIRAGVEKLTAAKTRKLLETKLGVYLEKYPDAAVILDDVPLAPANVQKYRTCIVVPVPDSTRTSPRFAGASAQADLEVIEWSMPVPHSLWLTDRHSSDGEGAGFTAPYAERPLGALYPGIAFTARLIWDGWARMGSDVTAAHMVMDTSDLIESAIASLGEHLRGRSAARAAELLEEWKAEGSYPYDTEPDTPAERAERDMFDIVAVTAAPALETSDTTGRAFSLALLAEALRSDQTALGRILSEVFALDNDVQARLAEMLDRTSLSSLVEISHTVVKRARILDDLHQVLFDDGWSKAMGEKPGLHDILARNTWVFGDRWDLVFSEPGLTRVARSREHMLATDITDAEAYDDQEEEAAALAADQADNAALKASGPVRDASGHQRRLDLLLVRTGGRKAEPHYLVIELKRPSRRLTRKDLEQVENHMDALTSHPAFANPKIEWTFMLVGKDCARPVQRRRTETGRAVGLVSDGFAENGSKYQVWVRTWAEVISEAQQRLDFVQSSLDEAPETPETSAAIERLQALYRDVLPADEAAS